MGRNVEIKARIRDIADVEEVRCRAAALATSEPEILQQRDTFYAVPKSRLKLREIAGGTAELIFYHRQDDAGPRVSEYTRTPVTDVVSMRELLQQSLGVKGSVSKRREVFLVGNTRVHLDEVDGLGWFVELEVVLAGDHDADGEAKRTAWTLMEQLGIRLEDLVEQAYVDLLAQESL